MAKLVLVRHGESVANRDGYSSGLLDVPLTAEGERQAAEAGQELRGMHFCVAYASRLRRGVKTAELLLASSGNADVPVIQDPALDERDCGVLQGKTFAECDQLFGHETVLLWRESRDVPPPGGESLAQVEARVLELFRQEILPRLEAGEDVLVAMHYFPLSCVLSRIGRPLPQGSMAQNARPIILDASMLVEAFLSPD